MVMGIQYPTPFTIDKCGGVSTDNQRWPINLCTGFEIFPLINFTRYLFAPSEHDPGFRGQGFEQ